MVTLFGITSEQLSPLPLSRGNVRRDIPVGLGASLLLLAFTLPHLSATGHLDRIGRVEGLSLIHIFRRKARFRWDGYGFRS